MLLTKEVNYYNKKIPVTQLGKSSNKKVVVMCPECKKIREVFWTYYMQSDSDICHKCANKKHRKPIKPNTKFGRLTVIDNRRPGYSVCSCECGEITEIANYNLRSGHTKSCGCIKKDNFENAEICKKHKHGNWKGGITPENVRIRKSRQYQKWRTKVFERDNYKCQKCNQLGHELRAHHIFNFADSKENRMNIDNGITLCNKCHKKFHNKYGNKTNKTMLDKFLSDIT